MPRLMVEEVVCVLPYFLVDVAGVSILLRSTGGDGVSGPIETATNLDSEGDDARMRNKQCQGV